MFSPQLLEDALGAVGDLLGARDQSVSLLVVGGAALLLQDHTHRDATVDVDVLAQIEDGRLVDPVPLPAGVREAARLVAEGYGLPDDWLNSVVATSWTGHWPPALPSDPLADARRLEFGGLTVFLVGRETLIPMKLHAAANHAHAAEFDSEGRVTGVDLSPRDAQRHLVDLVELSPTDADLDRAAAWVHTQDSSPDLTRSLTPSAAMSETLVRNARAAAARAIVETVGVQWQEVGYLGSRTGRAREVVIDPEALLVMTLEAVRHEPTLDQALAWWAVRGAALHSLPRVDYVLRLAPADLSAEAAGFAARVWGAKGASASWKRRAREASLEPVEPPGRLKGAAVPRVLREPLVMLRTRAFAGVGLKADLLAYLAARGPQPSTISTVEKALGYARSGILAATADVARAGLATLSASPLRYVMRPGVLDLGTVPPWRFWPQIAAFLIGAARWGEALRDPTPFLLSVEARALHAMLMAVVAEHPLPAAYPAPDPAAFPGPAYLEPFAQTVEAVARWIADGLPVGPAAPTGLSVTIEEFDPDPPDGPPTPSTPPAAS